MNTRGDAAGRFVLLLKARDLAMQAVDPELTMAVIDQIDKKFQIDALNVRAAAMSGLIKAIQTPDQEPAVDKAVVPIIDDALSTDRYDLAEPLSEDGLRAARNANDAATSKLLVERILDIRRGGAGLRGGENSRGNAGDHAVGSGCQPGGGVFPVHLERGLGWRPADAGAGQRYQSGAACAEELHAGSDVDAQAAVADDWWTYAEKQPSIVRQRMRAHAASLYQRRSRDCRSSTRSGQLADRRGGADGAGGRGNRGGHGAGGEADVGIGSARVALPAARVAENVLPIPSAGPRAGDAQVIHTFERMAGDTRHEGRVRLLLALARASNPATRATQPTIRRWSMCCCEDAAAGERNRQPGNDH